MKKILIITSSRPARSNATLRQEFIDSLNAQIEPPATVTMSSLTKLVFDISNDKCSVVDTVSGNDVATYDYVIIRNVGKKLELGIALAHYLAMKNVPFIDSYLESQGPGKLSCLMLKMRHNLPIPRTVYSSAKYLGEYINESGALSYPFILKDSRGKKGRDNYLVKSQRELSERLSAQPSVLFIAQEFIENDGDYRVLVLNGKITVVIKRTASGDTHLNNVSQGGTARLCAIGDLSPKAQADVVSAARIESLEVAGVDIIFDKKTAKHYLLEVNRAPQIYTGAFVEEKTAAYAKMISERLGQ